MAGEVSSKMLIPKTITVGFQKRDDTYTGKLGYVIYTDEKGKLRKETSWNNWRHTNIKSEGHENIPMSGFVLNKKVGGYKHDWNVRATMVRVFDPRGFEFEISVVNLLYVLQESNSIKGKGLEGEFVYAWSGTELVLLPVGSEEYKDCMNFTQKQSGKVTKNEILEGHSYLMKDMTSVMYLGKHPWTERVGYDKDEQFKPVGARHIFLRLGKYNKGYEAYIPQTGFTKIAEKTSTEVLPEFANAYDKFKKSPFCRLSTGEIKLERVVINDLETEVKEHYYNKNLILKENNNYYPARISKYSDGKYVNGKYEQQHSYRLYKGDAFDLNLKDEDEATPSFEKKDENNDRYYYNRRADVWVTVTKDSINNLDIYTLLLGTDKGYYDLIKNGFKY